MEKSPTELLKTLDGLTQMLSVAFEKGSLDEIEKALNERQAVIDLLKNECFKKPETQEQAQLLSEIIAKDKQAYKNADKLITGLKKKYKDSKKLGNGLLEYNKNNYNIMDGQLIDSKN